MTRTSSAAAVCSIAHSMQVIQIVLPKLQKICATVADFNAMHGAILVFRRLNFVYNPHSDCVKGIKKLPWPTTTEPISRTVASILLEMLQVQRGRLCVGACPTLAAELLCLVNELHVVSMPVEVAQVLIALMDEVAATVYLAVSALFMKKEYLASRARLIQSCGAFIVTINAFPEFPSVLRKCFLDQLQSVIVVAPVVSLVLAAMETKLLEPSWISAAEMFLRRSVGELQCLSSVTDVDRWLALRVSLSFLIQHAPFCSLETIVTVNEALTSAPKWCLQCPNELVALVLLAVGVFRCVAPSVALLLTYSTPVQHSLCRQGCVDCLTHLIRGSDDLLQITPAIGAVLLRLLHDDERSIRDGACNVVSQGLVSCKATALMYCQSYCTAKVVELLRSSSNDLCGLAADVEAMLLPPAAEDDGSSSSSSSTEQEVLFEEERENMYWEAPLMRNWLRYMSASQPSESLVFNDYPLPLLADHKGERVIKERVVDKERDRRCRLVESVE